MRPDLLSSYGGEVALPALDGLAASGLVFDDASTPCPMTRPSAAALLTGLGPDRTGVGDNVRDRLASVQALQEKLRGAGWTTAAFVATPLCSFSSGLDRGFDLFDGPDALTVGPARHYPPARGAAELSAHFGEWLSGLPRDRRFFAWIHLGDLHGVAEAGEPEEARANYRAALGRMDRGLASALDALDRNGRGAGTELVFLGTHGVLLGEDGLRGDAFWLRRETLRVPLVWRGDHLRALGAPGSHIPLPVWLPDVTATLAAATGAALDAGTDGRNLAGGEAALKDRVRRAWTWAPEEQFGWRPLTAVEEGGAWRVFDQAALDRVRAAGAGSPAERAALERPATPRARTLDPERVRQLEAAGVRLGRRPTAAAAPPADADLLIREVQRLRLDFVRGRPRGVLELSKEIVDRWPQSAAALELRLFLLATLKLTEEAAAMADRTLKLYPDRPEALHWAGHAALIAKKRDQAAVLFEAALSLIPGDADILYDLACERSRAGDLDGAIARLKGAIEAGYRDWTWMQRDEDLSALRSDPRYGELLRTHGR